MPDPVGSFLIEWHRMVSARDLPALERLLAADVSLGAPPYWERFQGRPVVHHLLGLIVHTIEDFTYHREWRNGRELALEFRGHVGDLALQGIDLISLNEQQTVQDLDVLMRPMNAVAALRDLIAPKMAAYFAAASRSAGGSA